MAEPLDADGLCDHVKERRSGTRWFLSLVDAAMLSLGSFKAFITSGLFDWNGVPVACLTVSAWYILVL